MVGFLKGQEITLAADFFALSNASFKTVTSAPGATLVLIDALRALRRDQRELSEAATVPWMPSPSRSRGQQQATQQEVALQEAASSSAYAATPHGQPLCMIEMTDNIGTITMVHNRKRNALCER